MDEFNKSDGRRKATVTIIIAEAGVNHNGDLNLAKKLIDAAMISGADIVKFQTFKAIDIATDKAEKAKYQTETTGKEESQLNMLKKLELKAEDHQALIEHCNKSKIEFLSTPFDSKSIDELQKLNLKRWKIPSGEITNLPYLRKIGSYDMPIILSTGMANLSEIESAINVIVKGGTSREKITVLHCTTEYPAPFEEVNLNAMLTIQKAFNVKVGYSDHTVGLAVPIAAVAMGATVIEKHLTLDRNMDGPDHRASIEPNEFKLMVQSIRNIEKSLGDGIKRPTVSEKKNISIIRKSLVASKEINAGEKFTKYNITAKRPGSGISPMYFDEIIGKVSIRHYGKDEPINWQ